MELGEVLHAGGVLGVVAGAQLGEVARGVQGGVEDVGDAVAGGDHVAQGGEQLVEATHLVAGPGGQALDLGRLAGPGEGGLSVGVLGLACLSLTGGSGGVGDGLPEGDGVAGGVLGQGALGLVTQAAFGDVEDAAQVDVVVGVVDGAQVGDGVLDLAAVVEAGAADDLVGLAGAHEGLFEGAGLGVGAVEDGDVAGAHAVLVGQAVDLLADPAGLVVLGVGDVTGDGGAVSGGGPQVLLAPAAVAGDDGVRGREDVLGGAVVLLQQDGAGRGVVLLELLDVADGGAAEGVDGLVGVADDGELARWQGRACPGGAGAADELAHEDVLGVVGVLVLVDQDVAEAAPVHLGHGRAGLEQGDGAHDDVVEVQGVGGAQALGVGAVDLGEVTLEGVGGDGALSELGRGDELVLEVGDAVGEGLGGEALGVDAQLTHDEGDEAGGVGGIVDGEGGAQAGGLVLAAQDAYAGGVEGGDPHAFAGGAHQGGDAFAHLGGGLVGEGDGQDLAGAGAPGGDEVGDAVGQDPGLARARAGDDEQGGAGVGDGGLLGGVEATDELGRV